MSKQPPPAPTASAVGPCPTVSKLQDAPALEVYPAPSHHPTTPNDMRRIAPSNIVSDTSRVAKFGESEIRSLVTHFSLQHDLSIDDCVSEYKLYKRLVCISYAQSSLGVMVQTVGAKYQDTRLNLLVVLNCCVLVPMTSVQCERGFSTQNRIKSKFRTLLNNNSLNDLMRILEGIQHP